MSADRPAGEPDGGTAGTERGGGRLDAGVLAELGRRYDTAFPGRAQGPVTMRNEAR